MNRQEILDALNLPFPCDFPILCELCQDPDVFERVLSLAIAQGESKGLTGANEGYNMMLRGYDTAPLSN